MADPNAPSTAPAPGTPADLSALLGPLAQDPTLGPIIQQMMASGALGGQPAQPVSLAEMLIGTSMEISGRTGQTGTDFTGTLPPWARDLAPEILKHPDFDPYLGIVSEQGDERVFMGSNTLKGSPLAKVPGAEEHRGEPRLDTVTENPQNPFDDGKAAKTAQRAEAADAGDRFDDERGSATTGGKPDEKQDKTLTVQQVLNLPYTWSEDEINDAMKRMRQAGIPVTSFDSGSASLMSVWQGLANRAAMTYAMSEGKKKVTPWDVLDMYKSEAKAAGNYLNYENGSKTTTNRSVANITEGEAWSSLQQTVSQMLGHDPSDQEVRDFAYRMNQLAAENPSISKTITKYRAGEATSSTTSTEGGFSAADVAQSAYEDAQSDPEYAEYQSATTYFNAALSALGAIGEG
jgi:hypothetical protein